MQKSSGEAYRTYGEKASRDCPGQMDKGRGDLPEKTPRASGQIPPHLCPQLRGKENQERRSGEIHGCLSQLWKCCQPLQIRTFPEKGTGRSGCRHNGGSSDILQRQADAKKREGVQVVPMDQVCICPGYQSSRRNGENYPALHIRGRDAGQCRRQAAP